jgi:hypothetical protein
MNLNPKAEKIVRQFAVLSWDQFVEEMDGPDIDPIKKEQYKKIWCEGLVFGFRSSLVLQRMIGEYDQREANVHG